MKYLLALIGEEGGMEDASPEEMKAVMDRWPAFGQELVDAGAFIAGEGLQEGATATTVRISDDAERLVTDGPFAETKDLIAGWYVIDVESWDRAVQLAGELSAAPGAGGKPIHEWLEVRPFYGEPSTVTE